MCIGWLTLLHYLWEQFQVQQPEISVCLRAVEAEMTSREAVGRKGLRMESPKNGSRLDEWWHPYQNSLVAVEVCLV